MKYLTVEKAPARQNQTPARQIQRPPHRIQTPTRQVQIPARQIQKKSRQRSRSLPCEQIAEAILKRAHCRRVASATRTRWPQRQSGKPLRAAGASASAAIPPLPILIYGDPETGGGWPSCRCFSPRIPSSPGQNPLLDTGARLISLKNNAKGLSNAGWAFTIAPPIPSSPMRGGFFRGNGLNWRALASLAKKKIGVMVRSPRRK